MRGFVLIKGELFLSKLTLANKKKYIHTVIYIFGMAPSNSHHQDSCIFRMGNSQLNLHLPLLWRSHTQNISANYELILQVGIFCCWDKPKPSITRVQAETSPGNFGKAFSSWWLNHPSERYAGQIGNLPNKSGVKIKQIRNHHLVFGIEDVHQPHFHPKI